MITDLNHMLTSYKCIRYAISCNVQDLDLSLECDREVSYFIDECDREFSYFIDLYGLLFINSHFTRLKLSCCMLNPTRVINWNKLTSLCISNGKLDEDSIENILSGSLLETLNLHTCYGFKRVDITSKSVKKLVLSGYTNPEDNCMKIEINAPNILSLTIQKSLVLWRLVLLNAYSLVVTTLDYTTDMFFVKSLKTAEENLLKGLILSLSHVKELKLGYSCSKILLQLKESGSDVKFLADHLRLM
nr:hypothetical protein [Tanacetum cinerariifolium]